jgi:hypothetical protein
MNYVIWYLVIALLFYVGACFAGRNSYHKTFDNPTPGAAISLGIGLFWPIVLLLCVGIKIIGEKKEVK